MPNWSDEIQTGLAQLEKELDSAKKHIAELESLSMLTAWNWNPKEAKSGQRYEVLIAYFDPAFMDTIGGWTFHQNFATKDLGMRWHYHASKSEIEFCAAVKVLAFREGPPMKHDRDHALTLVQGHTEAALAVYRGRYE